MAFGKGAGIAKSTNYVLSWGSPFMSTARSGRKREPQAKIQPQALCQKPKSKTQNPKPKTQNPKSKTENPKPNIQNPKTKILNVKRPPRAGKPTTFKASNRCWQRVAQADSVLLRRLITSFRQREPQAESLLLRRLYTSRRTTGSGWLAEAERHRGLKIT